MAGIGKPGRRKLWTEDMSARFPEGTFVRIERLLTDSEDRTDFVREAVAREVKRRKNLKRKKTAPRFHGTRQVTQQRS